MVIYVGEHHPTSVCACAYCMCVSVRDTSQKTLVEFVFFNLVSPGDQSRLPGLVAGAGWAFT